MRTIGKGHNVLGSGCLIYHPTLLLNGALWCWHAGNKSSGFLVVHKAELIARPSFLEYIKGGCELAFTVGRAFHTGRNLVQGLSRLPCAIPIRPEESVV